jgi:hypothetical protein
MFFPLTHAVMHAVVANASGVTPSLPKPTKRSTADAAAPRFAHSRSRVVVSLRIFVSSGDADAHVTVLAARALDGVAGKATRC